MVHYTTLDLLLSGMGADVQWLEKKNVKLQLVSGASAI